MTKMQFLTALRLCPVGLSAHAMDLSRKTRVTGAFERARDYDSHAVIQRQVADRLALRLVNLAVDSTAPALEIGCGTGFLTRRILEVWPDLPLTVSDITPAMLDRVRGSIGDRPNIRYALLDGEKLDAEAASLGLIASSLAFQWFETPADSVSRMVTTLRPGGWLAFSTLVAGSFREWSDAQDQAGIAGLTRRYPETRLYLGIAPGTCDVQVDCYTLRQTHRDGLAFLQSLKAIGANAGWDSSRPVSTTRLRRAIDLFERAGATISYEIADVIIRRVK